MCWVFFWVHACSWVPQVVCNVHLITPACLCRESRNLSDLCVDPLPCDRGVCGAHDPGRHRSSRLGRRSDHIQTHLTVICSNSVPRWTCFALRLSSFQFLIAQWRRTQVYTMVSAWRSCFAILCLFLTSAGAVQKKEASCVWSQENKRKFSIIKPHCAVL